MWGGRLACLAMRAGETPAPRSRAPELRRARRFVADFREVRRFQPLAELERLQAGFGEAAGEERAIYRVRRFAGEEHLFGFRHESGGIDDVRDFRQVEQ